MTSIFGHTGAKIGKKISGLPNPLPGSRLVCGQARWQMGWKAGWSVGGQAKRQICNYAGNQQIYQSLVRVLPLGVEGHSHSLLNLLLAS